MQFTPSEFVMSLQHPVGVIAYRADVANLIPHAKAATLDGQDVLIVPHRRDETRLLRNLGVDVPAPILYRYDWNGLTPYEAQRQTAALLSTESSAYVLNEFGTGKTRAALFAFDFMHRTGAARRMLVVAPLSTLGMTWGNEIRSCFPHLRFVILHAADREGRLARFSVDADIYIINHDAVRDFTRKILDLRADVVCIDELTAFKNAKSGRSKAMQDIAEVARCRWGMTGSPTPQGPEDAHGQLRVITPHNAPRAFSRWRDKVMTRLTQFKWEAKRGALSTVHAAMQPAVRFMRDDVVELPPLSVITKNVEMSDTQRTTYEHVMKNLRAQVEAGEVTVANEAVKLMKLLQISCGFVYTSDGAALAQLLDPRARLDVIGETIEEAQAKVLVFSPFVAGVDMVHAFLDQRHGEFGKIDGRVSQNKRTEVFDAFLHGDMRGIVAHPRTMSHGLNLHAASMIIWAAPYPSLEVFEQANARITRPGQINKQIIVQVSGSPVEARVYQRLAQRASMQNALLGMF